MKVVNLLEYKALPREPKDGDSDDPPDDEWVTVRCAVCTIRWHISGEFYDLRLADHNMFYCPVGHGQHFPPKNVASEQEKTEKPLDKHRRRFWPWK